jgi:hypothetical protein
MTATEPIFTKIALAAQIPVKRGDFYAEFGVCLTNGLFAHTRWQTDGQTDRRLVGRCFHTWHSCFYVDINELQTTV